MGPTNAIRSFTVYEQEEDEQEELHVYYGLELLEVVSADRNDPSFKMLVGRLSNAGVSRRVLAADLPKSIAKTIQRWGRALRSRNAQELVRVLEGRRANRKLTPEIKAYVRARWPDLVKDGPVWHWQTAAAGDPEGFRGEAFAGDAPAVAGGVEAASQPRPLWGWAAEANNRRGSPTVQPKCS